MSACGCACICHGDEGPDWPGPCAVCCEPGDACACGRALHAAGRIRSTRPHQDDEDADETRLFHAAMRSGSLADWDAWQSRVAELRQR